MLSKSQTPVNQSSGTFYSNKQRGEKDITPNNVTTKKVVVEKII